MMETHFLRVKRILASSLLLVAAACSDDDDGSSTTPTPDAGMGSMADASTGGSDGSTSGGDAMTAMDSGETGGNTIVDIAVADGRFTSLVAAVTKAGLAETLSSAGPFTVFAPTDDAFSAALSALGVTLDDLSAEELTAILTYHAIAAEVMSTDLTAGPVKTVSGISAFVSLEGGVMINDATVTTADISADNGVIHVIDKVLLPPNLVQAATFAGGFSTLLSAATSADLVETLSADDANLTVFAPTDDAFAAVGTLPTGDDLKNVLLYHVVSGKVLSTALTAGDVPTRLTGQSVTVDLSSGVMINDANVVVADVVATNGVIHVIDKVLLPPSN